MPRPGTRYDDDKQREKHGSGGFIKPARTGICFLSLARRRLRGIQWGLGDCGGSVVLLLKGYGHGSERRLVNHDRTAVQLLRVVP
jgi:hypothetical protein